MLTDGKRGRSPEAKARDAARAKVRRARAKAAKLDALFQASRDAYVAAADARKRRVGNRALRRARKMGRSVSEAKRLADARAKGQAQARKPALASMNGGQSPQRHVAHQMDLGGGDRFALTARPGCKHCHGTRTAGFIHVKVATDGTEKLARIPLACACCFKPPLASMRRAVLRIAS